MRQQTFNNKKSTLYLTATPIGNFGDFSTRAIETLRNVSLIACEDTRQTKKLTSHFKINTHLISCHQHNERSATEKIITALEEGRDVALVSDAGYPLISDPGSLVVSSVLESGFNVSVIPGPSAFLSALVASNLPCDKFTFYGFLSAKSSQRKKELEKLSSREETLIFYESPHRILETLEDMLIILGDRKVCLSRELTKKFEEYIRGNISLVIKEIQDGVKGEIVLIVDGKEDEAPFIEDEKIIQTVRDFMAEGLSNKDAISAAAEKFNLKKNRVYNLYHSN